MVYKAKTGNRYSSACHVNMNEFLLANRCGALISVRRLLIYSLLNLCQEDLSRFLAKVFAFKKPNDFLRCQEKNTHVRVKSFG